jgi:hypothetical protein
MASPPYISDREYLAKARILKKFGLMEINLRDKLTPALKGRITKLTTHAIVSHTDEYGNIKKFNQPPLKSLIKNPELFSTRKVSKKQAKKWKASGYKVINGRVIVRGETGGTTKVFANRIRITRKHIIEDIYLFGSKDFFVIAEKLLNKQLGKDEYILGRFGNNGVFKTKFVSYEDFYRYIAEKTENFTNEITRTLQLVHQYRRKSK